MEKMKEKIYLQDFCVKLRDLYLLNILVNYI